MTREERKALIYLLDAITPDTPRTVVEALIFEIEKLLPEPRAMKQSESGKAVH